MEVQRNMAAEVVERSTLQEFWKQAEKSASDQHAKGDSAVKFYVGAMTAAAGWFATNAPDKLLASVFVLCLGVFGTGHVIYYHIRAFNLHKRARVLAGALAELSQIPKPGRLYTETDEMSKLLRLGHPVTGALFNGLVVLGISFAYTVILALAGQSSR